MREKLEHDVAAYQTLFEACTFNEPLRVLISQSLDMAKILLREHYRMGLKS